MQTYKLIRLLGIVFLLSSCTGIQGNIKLSEIVLEDVRQAMILAEQADDVLAMKCWSHLEKVTIANIPDPDTLVGKGVGVLSIYQKVRNARRALDVKMSDQLRLECGPMLIESKSAIRRLGIRLIM